VSDPTVRDTRMWFEAALREHHPELADASIQLYVGTLFSVWPGGEAIFDEAIVQEMHLSLPQKSRPVLRAAWKHFQAELLRANYGRCPPDIIAPPKHRKRSANIAFPPHIEAAIRAVAAPAGPFPVRALARAQWGQVMLSEPPRRVVLETEDRVFYGEDAEWLNFTMLRGWASRDVTPPPTTPLIPMSTDSKIPATAGLLRQIAGKEPPR
jgi:hypothetical protein